MGRIAGWLLAFVVTLALAVGAANAIGLPQNGVTETTTEQMVLVR